MNKTLKLLQNYLLLSFPFVLIPIAISQGYLFSPAILNSNNILLKIITNGLVINLMLWILALAAYLLLLLLSTEVRNKTLARLANLKERDEREEYITGKAARATYLATLSLTLFLLFISMLNVNLSSIEKTAPGQPGHSISLGLGYSVFTKTAEKPEHSELHPIFDTVQYKLSTETILLLMLGWQLVIFNLTARKEQSPRDE